MDDSHTLSSQPNLLRGGTVQLGIGGGACLAPHLRGESFHVPLEVVLPALTACGVEVIDATMLRARCPAENLHTTPTGPGHCVIYPNDNVPQIFCHHTSCKAQVVRVNERLRACSHAGRRFSGARPTPSATETQAWEQKQQQRRTLEQRTVALRPCILEKYHWPANAIATESPVTIKLPVERQHRYVLDLFDDDDVLWCAPSVKCSGTYRHDRYFREAARWAWEYKCPGAFICPNTFEAGSYSRSDANIARRRFLVVESDSLSRDQVGAVFKWMSACLGMVLRAVVDTGGRSLHGWFLYPSEGLLEKLRIILPVLGCDPAMFRPAQPCRMPGVVRETRRWQELLYLAPAPSGVIDTNADATFPASGKPG